MPTGWRPKDYIHPSSCWEDDDPAWWVPPHGTDTLVVTAITQHLVVQRIRAAVKTHYSSLKAFTNECGLSYASLSNALAGRSVLGLANFADCLRLLGANALPTPAEIEERLTWVTRRQDPATAPPGNPHLSLPATGVGARRVRDPATGQVRQAYLGPRG